jgi:Fe2+ or Zn2+ uptake regulation protein
MTPWEQCLINSGYRMTASRQAMILVLQHATQPLSPLDILEQARVIHPSLGLVTVYRMINLLVEMGLVRRIHHEGGCHGYLPASPDHHYMVICQSCGKAAEFSVENDLSNLIERVQMWTGYLVDNHLLQLSGVCPTCQSCKSFH